MSVSIDGHVDNYVPDNHGIFITSAQGQGAIEGTVNDCEGKGIELLRVYPHTLIQLRMSGPSAQMSSTRPSTQLLSLDVSMQPWHRLATLRIRSVKNETG